jgi:murein DD-endopeptidase MepM/ murein hydrolase activator NlpD
MVAETPSRSSARCSEISIRLRLVELSLQIRLQRVIRTMATSAIVVIAVTACYFGLCREWAIAHARASLDRAELPNVDLRDDIARDDPQPADARSVPWMPGNQAPARKPTLEQGYLPLDGERRQKWPGLLHLAGRIEVDLAHPDAVTPLPETLISDAPPEPEPQSPNLAQLTRQAVAEAKRLLASTGLNVDRLFPQLGQDPGARGGPFVAPPKGSRLDEETPAKLEELRSLMRSLPLSVPLDYYQLESRFGPRHDPFNHRLAFHTGIDLSAPYMSQVHATAAGTVTFAGYRSDYGKVVEIDHGNGIATVYGHLHRFIVSVGQRVAEREQIGLLGSSGRSSGPHVHYEVLVNNEPQDPEKFIGLARVIPAAEK